MRIALIILLAGLFGFAAPAVAAADDRYDGRSAKYERYDRHGGHDRDSRRMERYRHRPDKHWRHRDQHKHRHEHYRGHGKHRGHSLRPEAYVVYRERVPVRPHFSIFLRIP